jgi:disulfide bond formation protein DsbB
MSAHFRVKVLIGKVAVTSQKKYAKPTSEVFTNAARCEENDLIHSKSKTRMDSETSIEQTPNKWIGYWTYLALLQSLIAIAGSLFFSEVMKLPPCSLCWYQRMAMYPLGFILAVSIVKRDHAALTYGLPLALGGFCVAIYHNLLYYK